MSYFGFIELGATMSGTIVLRDSGDTPMDATGAPSFRVYGPDGIMNNGTGSMALADPGPSGGAITGATNATPIVLTSIGHGLNTGTRVTVASVAGNTAANGDWNVTVIDSNTFSLDGSVGNGVFTSGGTWHVSGLYVFALSVAGSDGYVQGTTFTILVTAVVAGITKADTFTFTVV